MAEPSADVLQGARAGDPGALAELVQSQQSYVYSIAMSLMRNPTDAADMTQDAFLRALRGLHTYQGETRFTTWLYRLVTNVCLDALRRRGREPEWVAVGDGEEGQQPVSPAHLLADQDREGDPEGHLLADEESQRVRAAVDQLAVGQRLALTLYYFQDLSYDEIAVVLSMPVNTVKSHIRRAKAHLLSLLSADAPDQGELPCSA